MRTRQRPVAAGDRHPFEAIMKTGAYNPFENGERRRSLRMPYPTLVQYAVNQASGRGRIRDISNGGLFIEMDSRVNVGDPIAIDFRFRHGKALQAINGVIARTGPEGVAVRFPA